MNQMTVEPRQSSVVGSARRGPLIAVAIVFGLGLALLALEDNAAGGVVPSYVSSADFELAAYQDLFTVDPTLCEAGGVDGQFECVPFDDHGGIAYSVVMTAIAAAGSALVVRKRNPIGWLMIGAATVDLAAAVATAYAFQGAVFDPGSLPGTSMAALLGGSLWVVTLVIIIPRILLVIPSGRLVSTRWRWVGYFTYVVAAGLGFVALLHPLLLGAIPNPIAIPWGVATADALGGFLINGMLLAWVLGVVGVVWRGGRAARSRLGSHV